MYRFRNFLGLGLLFILLSGCGSIKSHKVPVVNSPAVDSTKIEKASPDTVKRAPIDTIDLSPAPAPFTLKAVPETPREFRGVWVATVSNIDWPSQPGLPVAQQKAELQAIMDRAALLNLNAIILQVRPSADALYDSPYEPWSEYLTGQQGEAPKPYYDPLKFAVKQAHRRGLELHAWFNPFRAYHPAAENGFAPGHVKNTHPKWVVKYGDYYWLDPGQKAARKYSIKVILDVVQRYDIDGVHLDDYFYPYPRRKSNGENIPFPDWASYEHYVELHGSIDRGDWRRQNVNTFVKHLSKAIKRVKPTVRFGISPFGIWRPGYPPQITGFDAYTQIYADSRKWLHKGWVDYLSPQLYWPIGEEGQSFPVLLEWWSRQNLHGRHLWPGLYTSRVGTYPESGWPSSEISNQIQITRSLPGASGHIHFSMQALMDNAGNISEDLLTGVYGEQALVPATSWISDKNPPTPKATLKDLGFKNVISLSPQNTFDPWLWVVKAKYGDSWEIEIYPGWKKSVGIEKKTKKGPFIGAAVTVVDKLGNESVGRLLFPSAAPSSQTVAMTQ